MTDIDANIRTLDATWLGWEGDGPTARVRLRGDHRPGELPDIGRDTEIAVVWSEPVDPTEVVTAMVSDLRGTASASAVLWSDEEIAKRLIRDLSDAGFVITLRDP